MAAEGTSGLSSDEKEDAGEFTAPRTIVIYEAVRRQGEDELQRPPGSLFWSGVAAGITIMASVIAEGALRLKIPADEPWREIVSDAGYSLGFIMVILGRMQLFTEQTIVTVLPITAKPSWHKLLISGRLWTIVFFANMAGAAVAAALNTYLGLLSPELLASMREVSGELLKSTPRELLLRGVPAGFLIASVAWISAGFGGASLAIIFALTYTISLGNFTHVVAGAAEAFLLMFAGQATVYKALAGIILPALIGNVIGGTGLFALLAHAQVRREM